jgi:putative oxidoreductase
LSPTQKITLFKNIFMAIALWIVSVLLALVFIASASMKLFAFDQYAQMAPELADSRGLVTFIGIAELAGALGLILPRITGILPSLSSWAALGLATIMVLATGFHLIHQEYSHVPITVFLFALAAFVVYGLGFRTATK